MKRYPFAALLALAGCGNTDTTPPPPPDVTMAEGTFNYYVVNALQAPMGRKDFSVDLNGDGNVDNQLGSIIGALSNYFDVGGTVGDAVASGSVVLLLSVQAKDLTSADNVGVTAYIGKSTMNPDFRSGMGMFAVDTSQSPAAFFGKINATKMLSNNPVTTKNPVTLVLKLPLIAGSEPLNLKVNGAHVQFNSGSDAASGKPGLLNGALAGSIKNSDIQGSIVPAVAGLLTDNLAKCAGAPDGGIQNGDGGTSCTNAGTIRSLFDTGDCMNPNGSMAVKNDNKIDICEVSTNSLVSGVLMPDVQIFAADMTTYAPNPKNTNKDSLSIGIGFTAVQSAKFP